MMTLEPEKVPSQLHYIRGAFAEHVEHCTDCKVAVFLARIQSPEDMEFPEPLCEEGRNILRAIFN